MICKNCTYSPICKLYSDFGVTDMVYDEKQNCKMFKSKSDFVEVVRCKDCTEWDEFDGECSHWYGMTANCYCSYGERRLKE